MPFVDPAALPAQEPRPGWSGRFFHGERMTFSYYDMEPGAWVHLHHHPHEEVWNVIEGELEVQLDGETRIVSAGQAVVVPSDVEHRVTAKGAARVIVVDSPARDAVGGVQI